MEPSQAELTALFELLDENKLAINSRKEPLEAHLVAVEDENGKVIGEVVEIRTDKGRPVMAMPLEDYEALMKVDLNGE